jgi:hypothetical protein
LYLGFGCFADDRLEVLTIAVGGRRFCRVSEAWRRIDHFGGDGSLVFGCGHTPWLLVVVGAPVSVVVLLVGKVAVSVVAVVGALVNCDGLAVVVVVAGAEPGPGLSRTIP